MSRHLGPRKCKTALCGLGKRGKRERRLAACRQRMAEQGHHRVPGAQGSRRPHPTRFVRRCNKEPHRRRFVRRRPDQRLSVPPMSALAHGDPSRVRPDLARRIEDGILIRPVLRTRIDQGAHQRRLAAGAPPRQHDGPGASAHHTGVDEDVSRGAARDGQAERILQGLEHRAESDSLSDDGGLPQETMPRRTDATRQAALQREPLLHHGRRGHRARGQCLACTLEQGFVVRANTERHPERREHQPVRGGFDGGNAGGRTGRGTERRVGEFTAPAVRDAPDAPPH